MNKEDLKDLPREELENIFIDLINDMEKEALICNIKYDETDDIEFHAMYAALLVRVNRIKIKLLAFNNKIKEEHTVRIKSNL